MDQTILITGATSGIGEASAKFFASKSYRVIITGRRNDRLEGLSKLLIKEHNSEVLPLCFDVCDRQAVDSSIDSLPDSWKNIDVLLNNAGLSQGLDPIQSGDIDDWERMIDTNVKGLLYVTRKVAPIMIKQGKGHIINIGSIAGKEVYLNGNVYCATKSAVEALTQAMRLDMLPHGIKVTQVAPGAVNTEFSTVRFHGNRQRADGVYIGFEPLAAADIAEVIWFVATRPPHVNIQDILVMPTAQASAAQIFRRTE
ncbi:MAG: SDR family oxidoreductase [Bacteroidales bacterium]|nr:SDR family oxidoreductase [Bacteroidales bacterium]MDZ4204867.1 SDR family oxidoreductase [Bacteroidales bacterium]